MTKTITLNPAQKQATETIQGPLLIVAGPGTGKTQLLSERIAHILKTTDTDPASILVMTFTESGVTALKTRLAKVIGPAGYQVSVHTFHSFCQSVRSSHPEFFLTSGASQHLSDIDKITIWKEILDTSNAKLLTTLGDKYFYLGNILTKVSQLKKENITPSDFKTKVEAWITELENNIELNTRGKNKDLPKETWKRTRKQADKALELSLLYQNYQDQLQAKGFYDYDDMIMQVTSQFKTNPNLLADFQEKFLYIMVDEYQDTNSAQNEILKLFGQVPDGQPNICVVGDDDQSIFRFQGASLENILFFQDTFQTQPPIVLTENYRSTQQILDTASTLISKNQQRLTSQIPDLDKTLHSNKPDGNPVQIKKFPNDISELAWISEQILEKVKNENASFSDFAIFLKTNSQVDEVADFLMHQKIPVTFASGRDLLTFPIIQSLIHHLKILQNPNQDESLARILNFPGSGISPSDVFKLTGLASQKNFHRKSPIPLFFFLTKPDFLQQAGIENPAPFQTWLSRFESWQKELPTKTLPDFISHFLQDSGFLDLALQDENKIQNLRSLTSFFHEIKNLTQSNPNFTLSDLLTHISLLSEHAGLLKDMRLSEEPFLSSQNAVHIMTAHKSKGLEFPHVFIPQCISGKWGKVRNFDKLPFPPDLLTHDSDHDPDEDERRLFFVALTRGEKSVTVSFPAQIGSGSSISDKVPSQFIQELDLGEGDETTPDSELDPLDFLTSRLQPLPVSADETALLKKLVSKFKLSPTSLDSFLDCPLAFKFDKLLHWPPKDQNKHQKLGTAFHDALEIFFKQFKDTNQLPDKKLLTATFQKSISQMALTPDDFADLSEAGKSGLSDYFDHWQAEMVAPLATEYSFGHRNVFLGEAHLTGKIDKIEQLGKPEIGSAIPVKIVDYKTGNIKSPGEISGTAKGRFSGRLKRQLLFYKILCDHEPDFKKQFDMQIAELDFVQGKDGKFKKAQVEWTDQDLDELSELIQQTWTKIQNLEFSPTPEPEKCSFCTFKSLCQK